MGNASLLFLNKCNASVENLFSDGKISLKDARDKRTGKVVAQGVYAEELTICKRMYENVSVGVSSFKSLEVFPLPMVSTFPIVWSNPVMVSCNCMSNTVRSVTTITLLKTGRFSASFKAARRYATQAIEFDLPDPALCWIR